MKAIVCTMNGSKEFDSVDELIKAYRVSGYTEDLTELRKKGCCVHREELDNQPTLVGLCGPMWDGGKLRYETWELYDLMSR